MSMKVTSPAFKEGDMIPAKYTADGRDISPPLKIEELPAGTQSIVIINDDPDAPAGTWVHWLVWNWPADKVEIPEAVPSDGTLPNGACQGRTDFGSTGYGGPAPPSGTHRYYFKVYALDVKLQLKPGAKKSELETAIKGHILDQTQLMGRYKRQR